MPTNFTQTAGIALDQNRKRSNIAARYYSARTVQLDDEHVGTVYLSGSVVYFLKVKLDRVAK